MRPSPTPLSSCLDRLFEPFFTHVLSNVAHPSHHFGFSAIQTQMNPYPSVPLARLFVNMLAAHFLTHVRSNVPHSQHTGGKVI